MLKYQIWDVATATTKRRLFYGSSRIVFMLREAVVRNCTAPTGLTLLHQPVLQGTSATAVLTVCRLRSSSATSGGTKGSRQSPFSPRDLRSC